MSAKLETIELVRYECRKENCKYVWFVPKQLELAFPACPKCDNLALNSRHVTIILVDVLKQQLPLIMKNGLENEKNIVRTVCHNILQQPMHGKKLQDTVIYHLKNFEKNLKDRLLAEMEERERSKNE